jgi:hypothetical protein
MSFPNKQITGQNPVSAQANPNMSYSDFPRQQTEAINRFIDNRAAQKRFAQFQEEDILNSQLSNKASKMNANYWRMPQLGPGPEDNPVDGTLLPSDFATLINHVAKITGWDVHAVLMLTLTSLSMGARGRYKLRLDSHWNEALNLYTMISAASGSKKSLLVDIFKTPFKDFEAQRNQNYSAKHPIATEQAITIHKAKEVYRRLAIKEALADAFDPETGYNINAFFKNAQTRAAEIAEADKVYVADAAKVTRLFADSFTMKKLVKSMYHQGGGIALFEPEGNSIVNILNDKRQSLDPLLKGYTMESFSDQSLTGGETYIDNPFLNIAYVVQDDIVKRIYSSERFARVGLTPRFLPYFVTQLYPSAADPDSEVLAVLEEKITSMLGRNYTQDQNREIYTISVSQEAYKIIKSFELEIANQISYSCPPYLISFMKKLHGTAARIAGILHTWIYDEPEKYLVDANEMQAGIAIARMITDHANYAFNPSGLCAYYDALKIIEWFRRHRRYIFTSRDVGQGIGNMTNANTFPALDLLEQHNIITQLITPNHPRICAVHWSFS